MHLIAIDLGKQSFHIHGVSNDGEVISRKVTRSKLEATIQELSPEAIAMEACASAHHWGRRFEAMGFPVRLIHPRFVMPFVKGSKNDAVDAEAIHEAAQRPTMRFVPVKTTEQQDLQMLYRTRDRLITQRTGLINHIRGLLGEYGVVIPVRAVRFRKDIRTAVAEAKLSTLPGVGPGSRGMDRFGSKAIHDRRQASAWRHRQTGQSILAAPAHTRCKVGPD